MPTARGIGARRDPWWRNRDPVRRIDPDVADMLRAARLRRGWSRAQAAARTGVSLRHVAHLEFADRAPSAAVAIALADGYDLRPEERRALLAVARPHAGRSTPYNTPGPLRPTDLRGPDSCRRRAAGQNPSHAGGQPHVDGDCPYVSG